MGIRSDRTTRHKGSKGTGITTESAGCKYVLYLRLIYPGDYRRVLPVLFVVVFFANKDFIIMYLHFLFFSKIALVLIRMIV